MKRNFLDSDLFGVPFTLVVSALVLTLCFCSCGHNLGTVVHGKFVNIGYDPEINKVGIQYVDGIMMTGVNKELSKNKLKFIDYAEKDSQVSNHTEGCSCCLH